MKRSATLLALMLIGCSSAAQSELPEGWNRHDEPGRFSVAFPDEWTVDSDADGRIVVSGPDGERVAIWPIYVRQALTATTAAAVLQRLAVRLYPEAQWTSPTAGSANTVTSRGRGNGIAAVAGLSWLGTQAGSPAHVFLSAAPEAVYVDLEDVFARILSSFRALPPADPSTTQASPTTFSAWQDPNEQAFTVDVPQGWDVTGGLVRKAAVDTRSVLQVKSPDAEVTLFIGDADIPPFALPTPMLTGAGFAEGTWYSPGYGVNMIVRRYRPGVEFARDYAAFLSGSCSDVEVTSATDRPDVSERINQIYRKHAAYQIQVQLDAGEVAYTCRQSGEPIAGYVFAGTLLTQASGFAGGGGIWAVEHLYGYLAPAHRADEAEGILSRVVASMRLNPAWVRVQQHLTGNVSGIVAETGQYVSGLISDAHAYRQNVQDEASRRFSNRMLELEDVLDPVTNETFKVESGAEYYWIDHLGNRAGTPIHENPDAARFREMIRLK